MQMFDILTILDVYRLGLPEFTRQITYWYVIIKKINITLRVIF